MLQEDVIQQVTETKIRFQKSIRLLVAFQISVALVSDIGNTTDRYLKRTNMTSYFIVLYITIQSYVHIMFVHKQSIQLFCIK